jgi:hypothetical protein
MSNEKELASRIAEELKPFLKETSIDLIKKAVSDGVTETLLRLGIDCSEPLEMQKDMSFLRGERECREDIKKRIVSKITEYSVSGIVVSVLAFLFIGKQ